MGCVVNGIGEGAHADIGIAGGKEKSALIKHGKVLRTIPNEKIIEVLLEEIAKDTNEGHSATSE